MGQSQELATAANTQPGGARTARCELELQEDHSTQTTTRGRQPEHRKWCEPNSQLEDSTVNQLKLSHPHRQTAQPTAKVGLETKRTTNTAPGLSVSI